MHALCLDTRLIASFLFLPRPLPHHHSRPSAAMNRYFTKRKAAKKAAVQPKVETLDIACALPPSDDFRTSLIMTSLSKRFSMLREQDDPSSMLGKASDDSVLGPPRHSRLIDFGYTPGRSLHDIAEVSSIRSSIRPPFASNRENSYVSEAGYGTDDDSHNGSVMSRPRPGEGNVLFGGRQKIYKIPMAGPASETNLDAPGSMKGRALYDDDVSMSTFQRWRQQERDRLAHGKELYGPSAENDSPSKMAPLSPTLGSITRHTSTSTSTSAQNGRTSTAATSINSQVGSIPAANGSSFTPNYATAANSADRSSAKGRRLYDQGLNRDIEEQQSSAMTRLNPIQKAKGRTSPPFVRSGSRQGYVDSFRPASPAAFRPASPATFRPASPAGPSIGHSLNVNFNFPLADITIPENPPPASSDPFSSPLMSSLMDRGKAPLGASAPPRQYPEKQNRPALRNEQESPAKFDFFQAQEPKPSAEADHSDSHSTYENSVYSTRSRAPTNASIPETAPSAFSIFQNAASSMRKPNAAADPHDPDENDSNFYFSRSSSGSEYENDVPPSLNLNVGSTDAAGPRHAPPGREQVNARIANGYGSARTFAPSKPVRLDANEQSDPRGLPAEDAPSESLGPTNGGLSGLVRQHLRHNSNTSSYYGEEAPQIPEFPSGLALRTRDVSPTAAPLTEIATPAESSYSHASNPFDLEDFKHNSGPDAGRFSPISPIDDEPRSMINTSPRGGRTSRRRGLSGAPETEASWQSEMKKTHARGPSAETIQEQDALSSELAKRQRAIQERLKARMESEVQAPSPVDDRSPSGPFRGFDMLRTKSSRESIKKAADTIASSRPGRALGFGAPGAANSERPSFQSDRWRSERSEDSSYTPSNRSRSNSRPPTARSGQKPHGLPSAPDSSRRTSDENASRDRKNSNPPIAALNHTTRSRSNSLQSNGRSISRNGRYKDDLEKAMIEGTSRVTTQIYPDPPTIPEHYATPPMPNVDGHRMASDQPAAPGLKLHTSRIPAQTGGYMEAKGLYPPPPIQSPASNSSVTSSPRLPMQSNALASPAMSPRPSPAFPMNPNVMQSPRVSPAPFPSVATPPLSGSSTPVAFTFPQAPPSAAARNRSASRKRSIQKSDIGEPRLISTTSVIDTVDLPTGASLKNGMDEVQNQGHPAMRRKFGVARVPEEGREHGPFKSQPYQHGAGYMYSSDDGSGFKPRHRLRKSSSEGEKLGLRLRSQAAASNPTLIGPGGRPVMEGGMF